MRWAIFAVYGLLLFVGAAMIWWRQPAQVTSFIADRELAANRLLLAGDLVPVTAEGTRYLRQSVKKGQKLELDDTSPVPLLTAKPGKLAVAFSLEWEVVRSGSINAGALVRICQAGKVVLEPVEVEAVLCAALNAPCIALADIPADKAGAVAGASQPSTPASLRVMTSQCE
jgi:hypothetical protein